MANALLTSDDVRHRVFRTHRLREGYDMEEVDALLDDVAVSMELLNQANKRLFEENTRLRKEAE